MGEQGEFGQLLEHYSEYLTDAANKDDLLQLGRHLFGSTSSTTHPRQSMELLEAKEQELTGSPATKPTHSKSSHTGRAFRPRRETPARSLTQEQITSEIQHLRQKNEELRDERSRREQERSAMLEQYDRLVHDSVQRKAVLQAEIRSLTLELAASLVRTHRESVGTPDSPGIEPIIGELTDLNRQILRKIGGFKESTRDALAHCERAALDRYKPKMEDLLARIYDGAADLPIDAVRERFDLVTQEIENQIAELQAELNSEYDRNAHLQGQTRQLEDRVATQREELTRMKKDGIQLAQEIKVLNELAVAELAAEKTRYFRLLKDESDMKPAIPSVMSARAVVVSGQSKQRMMRTPSRSELKRRDLANPEIPTVEAFIEKERARLMEGIRQGKFD
jgi:predicted nuclease with TOPRIM domain